MTVDADMEKVREAINNRHSEAAHALDRIQAQLERHIIGNVDKARMPLSTRRLIEKAEAGDRAVEALRYLPEIRQTLREMEQGEFPSVERCAVEARYLLRLLAEQEKQQP